MNKDSSEFFAELKCIIYCVQTKGHFSWVSTDHNSHTMYHVYRKSIPNGTKQLIKYLHKLELGSVFSKMFRKLNDFTTRILLGSVAISAFCYIQK